MTRLLLDTGVVIEIERGRIAPGAVVTTADDTRIGCVVAGELLEGAEQAETAALQRTRRQFAEAIITNIPIEPYDVAVGREHARLLNLVRRSGQPRGAHDLIIAATAAATDRLLVTLDAKARFEDLPGVPVRLLNRDGTVQREVTYPGGVRYDTSPS